MVLPGNALSFIFMGKLLYRVLERAGNGHELREAVAGSEKKF